ncbi:HAD family hydrolase [Luteolibacter marinus]|uniref:HAD family hydrolase n=1 Tax=Luteolibacter marinus TaxID=2776705 RepID=UPI0018694DB8|nr:HAD family hydrolase [Luteolibacter marinus]
MKSLAASFAVILAAASPSSADPLPSWNAGPAKQSVIDFVEKVSDSSNKDFVPVAERIAVFDNDGTLWCETPLPPQAYYAFAEIERLMPEHPEWKDEPAIQALAKKDLGALMDNHHKGLIDLLAKAHADRTPEQFSEGVTNWLASAKHPKFGMAYNETIYQPMLEVLSYLRDHGFKTYIVSGGGQDFMRVFSEKTYGIVPEQVIGTYSSAKFEMVDGKPVIMKGMDNLFIDDKAGKPEAIHRFIGRRPIACFGNSDGDQAMLEYTTIGNPRPSLGLIVHHTDAEREYAYDAKPIASGQLVTGLVAAKEHGWTLVDMAKDWKTVFPGKP